MKKTKIDWCDCTVNPVVGCKNGCKYCYGERINTRFHIVKNWKCPEFFPERLKEFESKTPKSVFIDSMSDIGTWKQEWFNAVVKAINDNPQHCYIALTKRFERFHELMNKCDRGTVANLYLGVSVTTQKQLDEVRDNYYWAGFPDFYSIEPILEPIKLMSYPIPKTLIIGAETGNRKEKVIPQKWWIDDIVDMANVYGIKVFMKESLRTIMGADFRQDPLPWQRHGGGK